MGGLFSREEPVSQGVPHSFRPTTAAHNILPPHNISTSPSYPPSYHQPARQPAPQAIGRVNPWETIQSSQNKHQFAYKPTPPRQRVLQTAVSRLPLSPAVYEDPTACEWDARSIPRNESFQLVSLFEYEDDFLMVREAFQGGAKGKHFKITKIDRVENPFLLGCYLLKKEEMKNRYGFGVEEQVHFHGTKKSNIKQICENNFNWRLHGDSIGNRFGKGVSFSPISYYASHYSDKNDSDRVMFYAMVLVRNSVLGNGNMEFPPKLNPSTNSRYDTAVKEDGKVTVKFCDNEFYPEFIIHYTTPAAIAKPKPKKGKLPHHANYKPQSSNSYACRPTYEYCYYEDDDS